MVTFIIVFGWSFQFGYNIGDLSNIKDNLRHQFGNMSEKDTELLSLWQATNVMLIPGGIMGTLLARFLVGRVIPGGIMGTLLARFLVDRLGRTNSLFLSQIFITGGAFLQLLSENLAMLMVGRLLAGVQCGVGNVVVPMFLVEFAIPRMRGSILSMHQLFVTVGILAGSICGVPGIFGTDKQWREVFFISLYLSLLYYRALACALYRRVHAI